MIWKLTPFFHFSFPISHCIVSLFLSSPVADLETLATSQPSCHLRPSTPTAVMKSVSPPPVAKEPTLSESDSEFEADPELEPLVMVRCPHCGFFNGVYPDPQSYVPETELQPVQPQIEPPTVPDPVDLETLDPKPDGLELEVAEREGDGGWVPDTEDPYDLGPDFEDETSEAAEREGDGGWVPDTEDPYDLGPDFEDETSEATSRLGKLTARHCR